MRFLKLSYENVCLRKKALELLSEFLTWMGRVARPHFLSLSVESFGDFAFDHLNNTCNSKIQFRFISNFTSLKNFHCGLDYKKNSDFAFEITHLIPNRFAKFVISFVRGLCIFNDDFIFSLSKIARFYPLLCLSRGARFSIRELLSNNQSIRFHTASFGLNVY